MYKNTQHLSRQRGLAPVLIIVVLVSLVVVGVGGFVVWSKRESNENAVTSSPAQVIDGNANTTIETLNTQVDQEIALEATSLEEEVGEIEVDSSLLNDFEELADESNL